MNSETQTERITESYNQLKQSDDHDYQRVIYETTSNRGWGDSEGYIVEAQIAGEPILKVVREDEVETIPFSRVVRLHTTEEATDD